MKHVGMIRKAGLATSLAMLAALGTSATRAQVPQEITSWAWSCAVSGTSALWNDFVQAKENGTEPILPDFSFAGYHRSEDSIPDVAGPMFDVTEYGSIPDDGEYDEEGIQAAIDAAAAEGGGVVFLPAGQYLVSPSETATRTININASRIVLRGAGSGEGGTEIVMVNKRRDTTMFRVFPTSWGARTVANITADANRETFWVTVNNAAELSVGQWVIIRYANPEYNGFYFAGMPLAPAWTRVINGGAAIHEVHQIAEISGNEVRFREPLHFDLRMGTTSHRLESVNPIEEVGIEDIRFTGKWDEYPEAFVHHRDWIHDSGWTILSVRQAVNAWVRRVEFRHINQAIHTDTASFITFDGVNYTGKKGHTSITHRRGYGVLVLDNEDTAAHHHGPGTGYNSVHVVYLRHKMQVGQRIDFHGGVPHATLLDQTTGGVLGGNGGPHENYPNHGRYLVFWNFEHRSTGNNTYDFWRMSREGNTFALPIFAGFTSNRTVTFVDEATKVQENESFGTPVTPSSLFEAQLRLRLCQ